ncbi:MAG: hypothetical protein Q4E65_00570 [Clostridia bacterium]|nr:hypothetical protein [Clostridia bacterium]
MNIRKTTAFVLVLLLSLSFCATSLAASDSKYVSQLKEAESIILAYVNTSEPGANALAAMGQSKKLKDFDIERFGKLMTTYLRYNEGLPIQDLIRDYGKTLSQGGVALSSCGSDGSPEALAESARAAIAWNAIALDKIKPKEVSKKYPCMYVDGTYINPCCNPCCR